MPIERRSIVLAANQANNNIMAGSIYEFMSRPTRVEVFASSSVATTGIGVNFGSRTLAQQANTLAPLEPAAGQGPRTDQDGLVDDVALPGERIVISLQDGGAGSTTRVLIRLTEG